MRRERVFIGSSSEAYDAAEQLRTALDGAGLNLEIVLWRETVWHNLKNALDSLETAINSYDYAIFLGAPDDAIKIRSFEGRTTRDNVIFEFGLFLSRLGNERTFFVTPKNSDWYILSDLGRSPTVCIYEYRLDANNMMILPIDFTAAIGHIKNSIELVRNEYDKRSSDKTLLESEAKALEAQLKTAREQEWTTFTVSSAVKARISNLVRLKSHSTGQDIYDVAEDAAISFSMMDDIVNIEQLSRRQRFDRTATNKLRAVEIFAERPIELMGSWPASIKDQVMSLRETVATNIKNGIKYTYFGSNEFPIQNLQKLLDQYGIDKKVSQKNVELLKFGNSQFKTFFTKHEYDDGEEVYMSIISENRNDLLVKLSENHAAKVSMILDSLRGKADNSGSYPIRRFI